MPCLRGHWPEAPNLTYCRWLTARPAVLAKTYGVRAVLLPVLRSTVRNVRFDPFVPRYLLVGFYPHETTCLISSDAGLLGSARADRRGSFQTIPAVGLGAVQRFVGGLQYEIGI
jgi:hypothetical protein